MAGTSPAMTRCLRQQAIGLPGLPDEHAVLVSRTEIDVDALHLVAVEHEELGVAKLLPPLATQR